MIAKAPLFAALLLVLAAGFPVPNASASSPVVISGPGVSITQRDLELELQVYPPARQRQITNDAALFRDLVNTVYRRARMARVAVEQELDQDALMQYRMRRAQDELLAVAARDGFLETLEPPNFTVLARQRYRATQADYQIPERVHARHILLRATTGAEMAARQVEAQALRERILSGEAFEDLARAYSEDEGSRDSGGDLGFFGRGRMIQPFEEAAFDLRQPGAISDPVESQFGIHLIQLVERQEAGVRPFEEVREIIESQLRADYVRDALTLWTRDVTDPDEAVLDDSALQEVLDAARERLSVQ